MYQDNRVKEDSKKREKVYQGVSGGNGGVYNLRNNYLIVRKCMAGRQLT